jgi:uncharacterized protein GlcG (DUF336 family)
MEGGSELGFARELAHGVSSAQGRSVSVAGPHTMESARRKAHTARAFRTATSEYANRYADNNRSCTSR